MDTWVAQATTKVGALEKELADLRQRYLIACNSVTVGLESLRDVTGKATEAAERSGKAAVKSVMAARQVVIMAKDPLAGWGVLISAEEAETAAETAAKAAREAAELVLAVLQAAKTSAESQGDSAAIQVSITSVLMAIRASEAATTASKLAHSLAALASATTLAGH